jgi:signal transduction histidine kinase
MPKGGQIMFRTQRTPEGVALDLIDTGSGMDERVRSQIFTVFYSTKPGGTGLGLPTVKKILEAHGGRIEVQSEPNRGTRFTIHLPAAASPPA